MGKINLTFLIPAYNEEKILDYGTNVYVNHLENLRLKNGLEYEVILCLNGCSDNSEKIAKKISKLNKRINYVISKKGFGNGLNTGILKAKGDIITFGNSDAELLPDFLDEGIKLIEDHDFILGSRYLSKQPNYNPSFMRLFYSKMLRLIFRILFLNSFSEVGVIKIFKKDWGKKFANISKATNFDWQVEIDAYAVMTKLKTAEIGVNYNQVRDTGESKVNVFKDTLKYIKVLAKYGPKIYLNKLGLFSVKFD